jgi:hypothetical protein
MVTAASAMGQAEEGVDDRRLAGLHLARLPPADM